jgi:hypothetical protein
MTDVLPTHDAANKGEGEEKCAPLSGDDLRRRFVEDVAERTDGAERAGAAAAEGFAQPFDLSIDGADVHAAVPAPHGPAQLLAA